MYDGIIPPSLLELEEQFNERHSIERGAFIWGLDLNSMSSDEIRRGNTPVRWLFKYWVGLAN